MIKTTTYLDQFKNLLQDEIVVFYLDTEHLINKNISKKF